MQTLTPMYNEFQKPLKDAKEWTEPAYEVINFSTDDEPENYTELYVDADEYHFDGESLTEEQYWIVDAYAKEAQQAVRESRADGIAYQRDREYQFNARY